MKKIILSISVLFLAYSCSNSEMPQQINGKWQCVSWINKARGTDKCNNNVYFEFREDKTYFSRLGSVRDSGTYNVLYKMLYVRPYGQLEFPVRINKLNNDTLIFLMNQGGYEEILTLVKSK
jgi:hypothetical protein